MTRSDRWVLSVTVLLLLVPLFAGGGYLLHKYHWAADQLEQLGPRHARLQGLIAAAPALEDANQQAIRTLQVYLYPADRPLNQTGNEVQQQVRDTLSAAGLRVGSSQVLPPKSDRPGLDRIQISIKAQGDLLGLQTACGMG